MVMFTNTIFFTLCLIYYRRLSRFNHDYARQVAIFMLTLGISSMFGAIDHAVHEQFGDTFFNIILFFMNAFSILAIYFNFKFTDTYASADRPQKPWVNYVVMTWVMVLLILSLFIADFTIIKIHAGIALIYCLIVFMKRMKREQGSRIIAYGILISFLSILVHSLHLMISIWFNHKDIAHVFMIITLVFMYKGTVLNLRRMNVAESPVTA